MNTSMLLSCSFCGQPQSAVDKLIAGPGVYICDRCVARAESGRDRLSSLTRCRFCGEAKPNEYAVKDVTICTSCLDLCREIIDQEMGTQKDPAAPKMLSRVESLLVRLLRRRGVDLTIHNRRH